MIEVHPYAYNESRSFADELNFLFDNNFEAKFIVSAGQAIPPLFESLGLSPVEVMFSDGYERGSILISPEKMLSNWFVLFLNVQDT